MTKAVFPVALILEGKSCLVVGQGPELLLRTRGLLDAAAKVVVVSSAPTEEIRELARAGKLTLHERPFVDADLNDQWLAVLVDMDEALATSMGARARAARVFFCAIDQPEHNTYSHMAQARAGLLTIAISTAGQAPALGRRLREELERLLAASNMKEFVSRIANLRDCTPSADRRRILGDAVAGVHFSGSLELGRASDTGTDTPPSVDH